LQQQKRHLFFAKKNENPEKSAPKVKPLPLQFKEAAYNKDYNTAMKLLGI
jgi:hypothetical protein